MQNYDGNIKMRFWAFMCEKCFYQLTSRQILKKLRKVILSDRFTNIELTFEKMIEVKGTLLRVI